MAQSYLSYSAHSVEIFFWFKLFIKVNDSCVTLAVEIYKQVPNSMAAQWHIP